MRINNNRGYETMQAEGYYNAEYKKGTECDMNYGMNDYCQANMMGEQMPGVVCPPIYECPRETVCHRYICHEVPQE